MRCWSVTVSGSGQASRWYYDKQGQLRHVTFAGGVQLTRVQEQPEKPPGE